MGNVKDITGLRYGKLVVLERDLSKTGGAAYWKCQCDCGTIKSIRGQRLRDGSVIDCGCGKKSRNASRIDMTSYIGKHFGRLTVLERDLTKPIGHKKSSYWICQCECGNIVSVSATSFRSGTASCGCLRKEQNFARFTLNLTNKRFGHLVALERTEEKRHGSYVWRCLCDCGNTAFVDASTLNTGKQISCGCKNRSQGEEKIEKLLVSEGLKFDSEYSFGDCKNPNTGYLYRYDFAIFENDKVVRLIEFDGEQHFKEKDYTDFKSIQFNDAYKNNYAHQKNIPLVRIPYTHLKNLTIADLLGDAFLV